MNYNLNAYMLLMDKWSYQSVFLINQYSDVKENITIQRFKIKYERAISDEKSLHIFLHLLKAFFSEKSYTLGKLASHISGETSGSKHQSTQTSLRRKLDIFECYQLVNIESTTISSHRKCYKITPTQRLAELFSHIIKE